MHLARPGVSAPRTPAAILARTSVMNRENPPFFVPNEQIASDG
jgi:hypothetical protein